MRAEDLIGTWRLRSWHNLADDGSADTPLGDDPLGYLVYSADGYMSVAIMAAGRAPFRDPYVFGGTPEEQSAAISTYLSYAGPFEVMGDEDTVIHHIEVSSYPNLVGHPQMRFVRLDGDVMVLSTKPMTLRGERRRGEIVWDRAGRNEAARSKPPSTP